MKHKCMPFLLKNTELTEEEENAIGTAWYLNNHREREREQEAFAKTGSDSMRKIIKEEEQEFVDRLYEKRQDVFDSLAE